jgi:hypothetical protein
MVPWDHTRHCVNVQSGREELQPYATWTLWDIEFVVARQRNTERHYRFHFTCSTITYDLGATDEDWPQDCCPLCFYIWIFVGSWYYPGVPD